MEEKYNEWFEFKIASRMAILYGLLIFLDLVIFYVIIDTLLLFTEFYYAFLIAVAVPLIVSLTYGIKKIRELSGHGGKSNMILDPAKIDKAKAEQLIENMLNDLKIEYELTRQSLVHGKFLITNYMIDKYNYKIHLGTYSSDKKNIDKIELSVGPSTVENQIYVDQIKKEIIERINEFIK